MDNRSWNINAPQWANFNDSIKSDIDEYFNTEQDLEARYQSGIDSPNSRNSSYSTPRSNGFASPMFTRNSNPRLNKTNDSLTSAMTNLQIKSAKKTPTRRSMFPNVSMSAKKMTENTLTTSAVIENEENVKDACAKKPKAEIFTGIDNCVANPPQSDAPEEGLTSEVNNTEENTDDNTTLVASPEDEERPIKSIPLTKIEKPVTPPKVVASKSEISTEPSKIPENTEPKIATLETRLDQSKRIISDKRIIRGKPVKPTTVLTARVRRQSIERNRRPSGEFVSLAEKLSHFQNRTPQRYRSAKHKDNIAGPLQKTKQTIMKLTTAMSPVLRCKYRSRTITVPNAAPLARAKSASRIAYPPNKHETKSKTFPRSKSCNPLTATVGGKADRKIEKIPTKQSGQTMPPPKAPTVLKQATKMLSETMNSNNGSKMSRSMMSETMKKYTPCKKTVPSVVSTETGTSIKDVEILHFGIPVGLDSKKTTRPIPFSFERRNIELNKSKKEKLKSQRKEDEKTAKPLFVARPAPSFNNVPKSKTAVLKAKDNNANQANSRTSFQERNELAIKKKQELLAKIAEQEKQARVFHAKPAPNFKPVFVRGNSTENLRLGDGNKRRTRGISPALRQTGLSKDTVAPGNQENRAPGATNQQCPKLKNPLMAQNLKIKKNIK